MISDVSTPHMDISRSKALKAEIESMKDSPAPAAPSSGDSSEIIVSSIREHIRAGQVSRQRRI